jgi:hypothetical protein
MKHKYMENKIHKPKKNLFTLSYIILELGLFCVLVWALFDSKFILAFLIGIIWIVVYFGPAYLSDKKKTRFYD